MRLGLSKAEFYELTPRLLAELLEQERFRTRETELRLALLRADLINFSFCRPKEPVTLKDLVPDWKEPETGAKLKRMTNQLREEIANAWRNTFEGGTFGEVLRGR